MLVIGFLINFIIFGLLANTAAAGTGTSYGRVVGFLFTTIQVEAEDGTVSMFWLGHRTHLDSRAPIFGDRVQLEYVKDGLGRNAVIRIAVLPRRPSLAERR